MQTFIASFSNREIALFFWLSVLFLWFLAKKEIRTSFGGVLKAFLNKCFLTFSFILVIYTILMVFCMHKIDLWDILLLKETLFWFFGVAFVLMMNITKVKGMDYFKSTVKHSIRGAVIIEFLVNFYTFSLAIELVFIPLIVILSLTKFYLEIKKER